jgi:hypothetical protein
MYIKKEHFDHASGQPGPGGMIASASCAASILTALFSASHIPLTSLFIACQPLPKHIPKQ